MELTEYPVHHSPCLMSVLFAYLAIQELTKTETTTESADISSERDKKISKHNQTIDQPHLARKVPQSNCQLNSKEDLHFDFLAHFHMTSSSSAQTKHPLSQDRLHLYRHRLQCPKALVVSFRSIP